MDMMDRFFSDSETGAPFIAIIQIGTDRTRGVATPKNRCRIIIFLIVINMGSAKEGLADASAPPRKTKAPPLHP